MARERHWAFLPGPHLGHLEPAGQSPYRPQAPINLCAEDNTRRFFFTSLLHLLSLRCKAGAYPSRSFREDGGCVCNAYVCHPSQQDSRSGNTALPWVLPVGRIHGIGQRDVWAWDCPRCPRGQSKSRGAPSRKWGNAEMGEDVGDSLLLPSSPLGPDPAACSSTELQQLPTGRQNTFQPAAVEAFGEEMEGCADPPAGAGRAAWVPSPDQMSNPLSLLAPV